MMMQELPMEQMGLAGSDRRMPPLERLDPTEIKQEFLPYDKKLMSPPEHARISTWPHPENFEDEQRAKNALTDNPPPVTLREFQADQMTPSEEERYNGQNPFNHGEPLPEHHEHHYSPEQIMHNGVAHIGDTNGGGPPGQNSNAAKKTSSRRNAWGNLSYADLITQAISASPEKRLTLSQVYDWMVQNIPYFKDKGDSNSSAGWKNSIRHNLSLHNRFIRVQNEGTGKSSWWMINPDAKAGGKASRRRASTAESGKCGFDSKRRGRSKKSLDLVRNGQESTPSPNGHMEGFPESPSLHPGFQFPHDMRGRAGSNASEYGGRISPLRPPHEFFQEGGWPGQEFGQCGFPGPPFGRPPFLEGGEQDPGMMDPRLSPHAHPALAHHLGHPNGFPYPRPGFPHPEYPQSPLLPPHGEHPQFSNLQTMSPAHVPSLSPNPHKFPSPDHHPPTSSHEPLMSPHHLNGPGVFFPSCAMSGAASPDSPAPGSSSSSGSILERALVKHEPESPHPLPTTTHQVISAGMDVLNNSTVTSPGAPGQPQHQQQHHHHHHPELHHQPQPHDWPIITQGFEGVNVEDYIKHDYDMDNHMAGFGGYNQGQGPPHPQNEEHQHSQYQPHNTSVSVGPPWVR